MEIAGQNISTRGDVAAAGLGYAIGFAIDNYFFPGGLTGGIVAAITATGSVGLKNFFHAIANSWKRRTDEFTGDPIELEQQAEKLLRYIERIVDRSDNPREHALRPDLEKYEKMLIFWKNGLIDVDEFYAKSFLPARQIFRKHLAEAEYVWVGT